MTEPSRVLIVANRTAVTPTLLEAVRARARQGAARFHLVVPVTAHDFTASSTPTAAGVAEAREKLDVALPWLSAATEEAVTGAIGDANPVAAIQDAMQLERIDEIIISTLGRRVSRWMRLDVVTKARNLGVPVTHVEPHAVDACMLEPALAAQGR